MLSDPDFELLFPWAKMFVASLSRLKSPLLSGDTLYITSDYSGSDKRSQYDVYSFFVTCLADSKPWQILRHEVRSRHLSDGRRLSFKSLNDKHRAMALPYFLDAARRLPGVCVTVAVRKSIPNLCEGELFRQNPNLGLRHHWNARAFEKLARLTHFVALLVMHFSKPGQDVYWVSDEDEFFSGQNRSADLIALLGMWTGLHVPHSLGEVGAGTTAMDPGDRLEEDLAAIPDLIAGATREYLNAVVLSVGGRVPDGVALEVPRGLSLKTRSILEWVEQPSKLHHLTVIFEQGRSGGYSFGRVKLASGLPLIVLG